MNPVERQTAIITGASSGIGRAFAYLLAERGFNTALVGRNEVLLKETEAECSRRGGVPFIVRADIRSPDQCRHIIEAALQKFGTIDLLVNNAGVAHFHFFADMSQATYETVLETNFTSVLHMTHAALPILLKKRSGGIVNVSSIQAIAAVPNRSVYCASKVAMRTWSRTLALELEEYGIRVLCVLPGKTETRIFINFLGTPPREYAAPGKLRTARWVAEETFKALKKGKRELILTPPGKLLEFANRVSPRTVDRIINYLHKRHLAANPQTGPRP